MRQKKGGTLIKTKDEIKRKEYTQNQPSMNDILKLKPTIMSKHITMTQLKHDEFTHPYLIPNKNYLINDTINLK